MRTELRSRFVGLLDQWKRYSDRLSAAYDARGSEEWPDLDAAAGRSGKKFRHLLTELAGFAGCSDAFLTELVACAATMERMSGLGYVAGDSWSELEAIDA